LAKIIIISFLIAALGFFPLMGLPGVLILGLCKPVLYLIYGPMAYEAFTQSLGDKTWPLMMMLSILWPISIPVAYFLCQKYFSNLAFLSLSYFIPFCVFILFGSTIISTLTVVMSLDLRRLYWGYPTR